MTVKWTVSDPQVQKNGQNLKTNQDVWLKWWRCKLYVADDQITANLSIIS